MLVQKFISARFFAEAACCLLITVAGSPSQCLAASNEITYQNSVIPGEHPDPSIIRAGKEYWATATSADWAPHFQLLRSPDLVNWEVTGAIFTNRPSWAASSFWAPEISEYKGKFYVYYTARNHNGNLRVAVAKADKPDGPYTDLGPIATEDSDSIDPAPFVDEKGNRYLIWKSDGNAHHLPTAIWAQQLDESGAKLLGKRTALIGNDADWEGPLVEAPFILRRGEWFYLFYSGSPCCGFGCHYAMGVARSRNLLGPWTKDPANPIMVGNEHWQCPGHGSIVTDEHGRYWLLYHAYSPEHSYFTGREAVLDEVKFAADDWPTINDGKGPSFKSPSPLGAIQRTNALEFFDDFKEAQLKPGWIWPNNREPIHELREGKLIVKPRHSERTDSPTAFFGQYSTTGDYFVETAVETASLKPNSWAGIAIAGNAANAIGLSISQNKVTVGERREGNGKIIFETKVPEAGKIFLKITIKHGNHLWFSFSTDESHWTSLDADKAGKEFSDWNAPLKVVLAVGGNDGEGEFDFFRITPL